MDMRENWIMKGSKDSKKKKKCIEATLLRNTKEEAWNILN